MKGDLLSMIGGAKKRTSSAFKGAARARLWPVSVTLIRQIKFLSPHKQRATLIVQK